MGPVGVAAGLGARRVRDRWPRSLTVQRRTILSAGKTATNMGHSFAHNGICTLCGSSEVAVKHFGWGKCGEADAQALPREYLPAVEPETNQTRRICDQSHVGPLHRQDMSFLSRWEATSCELDRLIDSLMDRQVDLVDALNDLPLPGKRGCHLERALAQLEHAATCLDGLAEDAEDQRIGALLDKDIDSVTARLAKCALLVRAVARRVSQPEVELAADVAKGLHGLSSRLGRLASLNTKEKALRRDLQRVTEQLEAAQSTLSDYLANQQRGFVIRGTQPNTHGYVLFLECMTDREVNLLQVFALDHEKTVLGGGRTEGRFPSGWIVDIVIQGVQFSDVHYHRWQWQ